MHIVACETATFIQHISVDMKTMPIIDVAAALFAKAPIPAVPAQFTLLDLLF